MNDPQALAFVDVLNKGPAAVFLAATLGHDGVPSAADFESVAADSYDRCSALVDLLNAAVNNLSHQLENKEYQRELDDLGPEEPEEEDETYNGTEDTPAPPKKQKRVRRAPL